MTNSDHPGLGERSDATRVVTCDMAFLVSEPTEVVVQVVASRSAGQVDDARFEVLTDGERPSSLVEVHDPEGATLHVIRSIPGRLTLSYRARIRVSGLVNQESSRDHAAARADSRPPADYERQVYLRPSRYCPSDHLIGFAVAEFGAGPDMGARTAAIAEWIRQRIGYVPGSGTVHDSAEDTLLTGVGTCRDFAHLGIALCRATGVPARFAAVYAPGLSPMDFHAVFEAFEDGRWFVYDPTGLAPRESLVRVVTGRDAADAAFAAVTTGIADLQAIEVTAVAEPFLPVDDHLQLVELS
jgi:transglutaminase-like putative cysteine protease